jgi:FHA domain-containing protein
MRDLAAEEDVAVATLELDRAAFVAGFPTWFLIIPAEQAAKPSVRFRTVLAEDLKRLVAAADEDQGASTSFKSPRWNRQRWRAEPLKKRITSPFADRISIGRASNVDVVIRSRVVSKLHAHFVLDGEGAPTVTDLDSHNGTFINNSRHLTRRESSPTGTSSPSGNCTASSPGQTLSISRCDEGRFVCSSWNQRRCGRRDP